MLYLVYLYPCLGLTGIILDTFYVRIPAKLLNLGLSFNNTI